MSEPTEQHGILIAVGDPDLQWRLARTLTVAGHRVVGTASADGALSLLSHWPVRLVVVSEDVCGTMSAAELVSRILERDCEAHIAMLGLASRPARPDERAHFVQRDPVDWPLLHQLIARAGTPSSAASGTRPAARRGEQTSGTRATRPPRAPVGANAGSGPAVAVVAAATEALDDAAAE